jgi:hypothetical protein
MASGTWQTHGTIIRAALQGAADLDGNANINWMFTGTGYTPNPDHEFQSSLTANEITGTNLPAGGVDAAGSAVSYDAGTNTVTFTVNDLSVATATATGIKNAHLVDQTGGSAATNRIIASVVFDTVLSPEAGTLSIDVPADGVFSAGPV